MTDKQLTEIAYRLSNRFEAINTRYLKLMGHHIQEIGTLSPTDVHRLEQFVRMGINLQTIKEAITFECSMTIRELDNIFDELLDGEYSYSEKLFELRNVTYLDLVNNNYLRERISAIRQLTANSLVNVANTTVTDVSYRNMVDKAVYTVSNGLQDYGSVMRDELKKAGAGLRVQYESGRTRRLDSAIRMNILDACRQVNDEVRKVSGELFRADGYEISAHALCAPDHQPIQGRQFAKGKEDIVVNSIRYKSYDNLNDNLKRPIGTLNCKHSIHPIILGVSKPTYTNEQLEQFKQNSNEKVNINNRDYTKYECSQLMRKLETEMRYTKDQYILARASNDKELMQTSSEKLNMLQAKYREVSNKSGLVKRYERAYVPGYR